MDHGIGCGGCCEDDTSNSIISAKGFGSALAAAGVRMDVMLFDACLMDQEEFIHQVQPYGGVFVGSQDDEFCASASCFDKWCGDLSAKPTMTAKELGADLVTRYSQGPYGAGSFAAIDLTKEPALAASLDAFAQAAIAAADWLTITNARAESTAYPLGTNSSAIDLGSFLLNVAYSDASLNAAAITAYNALNAEIISNYSGPNEAADGTSIFVVKDTAMWEDATTWYTADTVSFLKDTHWLDFQSAYAAALAAGQGAPPRASPLRTRLAPRRPGPPPTIFSQCSARPRQRP